MNSFTTPSILATTNYYAQARNAATGCISTKRLTVAATINSIPATPASISGTLSVCPIATTGYTFSTPRVGGVTYQWTLPSCAVASTTPQSTTNSIIVRFPGNTTTDMMKVQLRSSAGCLSNVREIKVTSALNCVACVTAPVVLTTMNNVKADNPIPAMTIALDAKLFPNPSLGIFNLNVKSSSDEIIHVRVLNLSGKVLQIAQMTPMTTISVARDLIPGMYMIEVRQGDQLKILKAVKL
jgi:hypothetical protein